MDWKKVFLAGVAFAVIAQVVHSIEAFFTMNYYLDPAYFGVWSKIMMPGPGAPPTEFYVYSILFAVITGLLLAYVYSIVRNSVPGKGTEKGLWYGLLVFLVAGLPGALSMYLLVNLPTGLLACWTASMLVIDLAGGVAIAKVVD